MTKETNRLDRAVFIDLLFEAHMHEKTETQFRLDVSAEQIRSSDAWEVVGRDAFFLDAVAQRADGWFEIFVKKLQREGHKMVSLRELKEEAERMLTEQARRMNGSSSYGERLRHELTVQVLGHAANDPMNSRVPLLRSFTEAYFESQKAIAEGKVK
jgi:hypothetical protein